MFKKFLLAIAIAAPFFAHAGTCSIPEQAATQAQAALVARQYKSARMILRPYVRTRTKCGLLWLNAGHIALAEANYPRAARAYKRVITLNSPLAPAARYYLAQTYARQENWIEAAAVQAELEPKRLPAALADLTQAQRAEVLDENIRFGLRALKERRFASAEEHFIAALNLKQSAMLYAALAMALSAQEEWDRERATLQYGRAVYRTQEELRILHRLEQDLDRKWPDLQGPGWHLRFDLATGYDSNVRRTVVPLGSAAWRGSLEIEKAFYEKAGLQSNLRFGSTYDYYAQLSEERYNTFYLANVNAWALSKIAFEIMPQVSYEIYGEKPYLLRAGARGEASTSGDFWKTGLVYEYLRNLTQNGAFPFNDSESQTASMYFGYSWMDDFSTSLTYAAIRSLGSDDEIVGSYRVPIAFTGHGPTVKAFWSFLPKWMMRAYADYSMRNYARNFLPQDRARRDTQLTTSIKISYLVKRGLTAYVEGQYQLRRSNMGDDSPSNRNWDDRLAYTGIFWEVF